MKKLTSNTNTMSLVLFLTFLNAVIVYSSPISNLTNNAEITNTFYDAITKNCSIIKNYRNHPIFKQCTDWETISQTKTLNRRNSDLFMCKIFSEAVDFSCKKQQLVDQLNADKCVNNTLSKEDVCTGFATQFGAKEGFEFVKDRKHCAFVCRDLDWGVSRGCCSSYLLLTANLAESTEMENKMANKSNAKAPSEIYIGVAKENVPLAEPNLAQKKNITQNNTIKDAAPVVLPAKEVVLVGQILPKKDVINPKKPLGDIKQNKPDNLSSPTGLESALGSAENMPKQEDTLGSAEKVPKHKDDNDHTEMLAGLEMPRLSDHSDPDVNHKRPELNGAIVNQGGIDDATNFKPEGLDNDTGLDVNPDMDDGGHVQKILPNLQNQKEDMDYVNDNPLGKHGLDKKPRNHDDDNNTGKISQFPTDFDNDSINGESSFFSYFIFICVVVVAVYVGYHNRHKVLGLLFEGRSGRRHQRKRGGSHSYSKLETNLEDALSSNVNKNGSHVIY